MDRKRSTGMMKDLKTLLLLMFIGAMSACYYDVESELYPNGPSCDTTNVTFKVSIKQVFERNNCLSCHNGGLSSGGVNLDNHASVVISANSGKLLSSVIHDGKASKMPQGGAKISDCDIKKLEIWIKNGTPDN